MGPIRTRRLPPPPGTLGDSLRRSAPLFAMGGLFLAGAVCGSGLYPTLSEGTSNTLMFLLSGARQGEGFRFWHSLCSALLSNFAAVGALFLCGFCAVSQPLVLALPFVKGLGFGLVAAYNTVLFSPYSAFFWLKFLPGAFLTTVLILLCARQSLKLSVYVFRAVFSAPVKEGRFLPSAYGAQYVLFAVLCLIFSLIDTLFDLAYEIVSHG